MRPLLLFAGLALLSAPVLATSRVESEKKMTVLVTSEGFLGGGRGSGVLIDSVTVLTCAHMADAVNDEFFVYTYPFGEVIKAKIEDVDMSTDLLTLHLEHPVNVRVRPVFQPIIEDGDQITVVGNSAGAMKWYVTRGVVTGRERDYLMTDAQIHPGNSGGPWFNDNGEIVAISDFGLVRYPDISGGVSALTIQTTIKHWARQKRLMNALMKMFGG